MLFSSVWVYLTVVGRGIFEDVPARLAWMLPFDTSAWEQTSRSMIPHGTSLSEVIQKLGQPDEISEPHVGGNVQHLTYLNPHNPDRFIIVSIGPDGKVINSSSGSGPKR